MTATVNFIQYSDELCRNLLRAQMRHTRDMLNEHVENNFRYYSDDAYDYMHGALTLCEMLTHVEYDSDSDKFNRMFNERDSDESIINIPCDGICNEIYELNCIALYDDDIDYTIDPSTLPVDTRTRVEFEIDMMTQHAQILSFDRTRTNYELRQQANSILNLLFALHTDGVATIDDATLNEIRKFDTGAMSHTMKKIIEQNT